jgi:hypothetical protein
MLWRSCERFGIKPPFIQERWENNTPWIQAELIGYNQVREIEDSEAMVGIMGAMFGGKK